MKLYWGDARRLAAIVEAAYRYGSGHKLPEASAAGMVVDMVKNANLVRRLAVSAARSEKRSPGSERREQNAMEEVTRIARILGAADVEVAQHPEDDFWFLRLSWSATGDDVAADTYYLFK